MKHDFYKIDPHPCEGSDLPWRVVVCAVRCPSATGPCFLYMHYVICYLSITMIGNDDEFSGSRLCQAALACGLRARQPKLSDNERPMKRSPSIGRSMSRTGWRNVNWLWAMCSTF